MEYHSEGFLILLYKCFRVQISYNNVFLLKYRLQCLQPGPHEYREHCVGNCQNRSKSDRTSNNKSIDKTEIRTRFSKKSKGPVMLSVLFWHPDFSYFSTAVSSLCPFYKYFHVRCSNELSSLVPGPHGFKGTTRWRLSHRFKDELAKCKFYSNIFFTRTSRLRNSSDLLLCFQNFKRNVNRHLLESY